jgi:hypothetical protein
LNKFRVYFLALGGESDGCEDGIVETLAEHAVLPEDLAFLQTENDYFRLDFALGDQEVIDDEAETLHLAVVEPLGSILDLLEVRPQEILDFGNIIADVLAIQAGQPAEVENSEFFIDDFLLLRGEVGDVDLEEVLAVDFLREENFALAGGFHEEVVADEEVEFLDEAGVEEVGDLHDQAVEGPQVEGSVDAQRQLLEFGVVTQDLRETLRVLLHLHVLLRDFSPLQLLHAQLLQTLALHLRLFYDLLLLPLLIRLPLPPHPPLPPPHPPFPLLSSSSLFFLPQYRK